MTAECTVEFFFECYAPHRDLHSFPTRRSSDLDPRQAEIGPDVRHEQAMSAKQARMFGHDDGLDAQLPGQRGRSEEHTSELQSRLHLVCRLLLEKKNNGCPSGRGASSGARRFHV